jgi:quercetin dioxygenase-like cupin family protein
LHDHIRWEEREFFEAVQRDAPEALTGLAQEAGQIEARRPGSRARTSPAKEEAGFRRTPMTDDRPRPAPSERFAPGHTLLDLAAEIAALRSEPSAARHGHRQKTLFKHGARTIALFAFDAGAGLPEHKAPGTVTIQTVEGEVNVSIDGVPAPLRQGQLLVIAPNIRHAVKAEDAASILVQVSLASPGRPSGEHP